MADAQNYTIRGYEIGMPLQVLIRRIIECETVPLSPLHKRPFPLVPSSIPPLSAHGLSGATVIGREKSQREGPLERRDAPLIVETPMGGCESRGDSQTIIVIGTICVGRKDQQRPRLPTGAHRTNDKERLSIAFAAAAGRHPHRDSIKSRWPCGRHFKRYLAALSMFPSAPMFRCISRDHVRLHPHRR